MRTLENFALALTLSLTAAAVTLSAPRAAHADCQIVCDDADHQTTTTSAGRPPSQALLFGTGDLLLGGLDIGLSIHDMITVGENPNAGYGGVETIVGVAGTAMNGYWLSQDGGGAAGMMFAWNALLAIHGAYEIYSDGNENAKPLAPVVAVRGHRVAITPTMVSDGAQMGSGVGFAGRF